MPRHQACKTLGRRPGHSLRLLLRLAAAACCAVLLAACCAAQQPPHVLAPSRAAGAGQPDEQLERTAEGLAGGRGGDGVAIGELAASRRHLQHVGGCHRRQCASPLRCPPAAVCGGAPRHLLRSSVCRLSRCDVNHTDEACMCVYLSHLITAAMLGGCSVHACCARAVSMGVGV